MGGGQRRGRGTGEMVEDGLKVQTSSYEINKPRGYNVQHSDYS